VIELSEVTCPACWETIELTLDLSAGSQSYTEDCPVCCRPMSVHLHVGHGGEDWSVEVEPESD
jgi:hypothetical protein